MTEISMSEIALKLKELDELKKDFQEIKDVREIKDCFRRFHWACCGGFNGRQGGGMESLDELSDDATFEVKGLHEPGKGPQGREEFTKYWAYYYGDAGPLPYIFQVPVSETVEVDGDTAVGWSVHLQIGHFRGDRPALSLMLRTNDYVRTAKGWKIRKTTIDGGLGFKVDELVGIAGTLNPMLPPDGRTPWTYEGA
jgi:hypothetical protein